jgi:hypothetical protein
MMASGTTPHGSFTSSSVAKYVITPHTPQEHDAGLILAALAGNSNTDDNAPSMEAGEKVAYSLTFPELVHKMVMETDANNPKAIRWTHDGEAFVVSAKV